MATGGKRDSNGARLDWIRPLPAGRTFANVVEQVREAIETGELAAGEKLPSEPELAAMFGISRSVLREALKVLELSGYLEVRRGFGGGTFVCPPHPEEFAAVRPPAIPVVSITSEQLVSVRLAIEPFSARLAAEQATPGMTAPELASWEADETRPARVLAAAVDFHIDLAHVADNPIFVAVLESLRPALYWAMRNVVDDVAWRHAVSLQHQEIADAVAAGDADLAASLMREHVLAEIAAADFTPMPR
jgi:GntR family transcriptional regulator, transcriptional repressor for pyruvate dehydrogenase complex